ncbi:MAG: hypothetical protein ABF553_07295 [Acetobacter orientalis]|uniref:hypothetical protein n=1 Tax=Acetobacter orientalis TaxID=146474 RepID=UPI0039E9D903
MALTMRMALLGASFVLAPSLALAQEQGASAPTADSAAAQVGKSPKAALDENGKRVEPSKKLWTNPRTEAEQPGTQPPSNAAPADSGKTQRRSGHHGHAHKADKAAPNGQEEGQSVTSPLSGAKSN